mgnify:CR=1 FL=1
MTDVDFVSKKCVPCEEGTPPLTKAQAEKYLKEVPKWELVEDSGKLKIRRRFQFDTYLVGIDFVNKVAKLAEVEGHHPDIFIGYKRVTVNLITHAIGGLSENDFIMAAKINQLTLR